MLHGISLSKAQSPSTQEERDRMNKISYASAIGSIMYAMLCTRSDVLYALSEEELIVRGYTDASFQTDKDDSRSQSGYVFCLNGGAFVTEFAVVPSIADPVDLYCDNNGAIVQGKEPRSHQRSKHIIRRFHLIREIIDRGDVKICRIPTDKNLADPLTKPLVQRKHEAHTRSIGIRQMPDWL
ncbi:hypothetical protein CRG98_008653 [Punica granatum]|uniref:Reverse transcriptase Ty1/copia-type domain-containing protein n=1 Tax=Punica granatum TaxID=22663 RepID=A0A2I0KRI8_PUNGR|nr:hypothetical protein CRG98_008653 [Punica granatum]